MNVKKNRHNAGFTMVELLTVVAILVILMGVSAVAVIRYQRNLHLKEMDSIAKEIFVAAQNHLSAADSQNLLSSYATSTDGSGLGYADGETNYIICTGGNVAGGSSALEQILPFGSIDETTRSNGSFILHYNKKSARVLDVFYATKNGRRYGHDLKPSDYNELKEEEYHGDSSNQRENRKHYSEKGASNAVVGWYGGDDLGTTILNYLEEPVIQVENGDQLKVTVSNFTAGSAQEEKNPQFKLIVRGLSSGSLKEFPLNSNGNTQFSVVLDDVSSPDSQYSPNTPDGTPNGHFASVMKGDGATGPFYPGENIEVWALALDNGRLSNIAESGRVVVNSLFDEVKGLRVGTAALGQNGGGNNNPTQNAAPNPTPVGEVKIPAQYATISSFRHLLNLDGSVSGLDLDNLKIQKSLDNNDRMAAVQVSDLDWSQFMTGVKTIDQVRVYKGTLAVTDAGYYLPVNPSKKNSETANTDIPLQYWGNNHSIKGVSAKGVVTNAAEKTDAGLFQQMINLGASTSRVESLNLINFTISGTGSVGALAGTLTGSVINTAVYNDITGLTDGNGNPVADDRSFEISSTGDCAGGLVGVFSGGSVGGKVSGCGAAVYVKADAGSAGGLIGTVSSGTVENSYSGGHTEEGCYKLNSTPVKKPNDSNKVIGYTYTVVTDGNARLNIQGSITGGLIGTLSDGGTVSNCYSTCSVGGTTAGGFVGKAEGGSTTTISGSYCTGLVTVKVGNDYEMFNKQLGVHIGTFAGSADADATLTSNHYLDLINHRDTVYDESTNQFNPAEDEDQMKETGNGSGAAKPYDTSSDVSAIDESANSYNSFIGTGEKPSLPYDDSLKANAASGMSYVKDGIAQFGFRPIQVTNTAGDDEPLLHHGDWPIYETRVFNSIN